ncbi:MAG: molybdenum cofactor guanylyltransferase MobA, partial [Burkholderiaceae bacterium]
MEIQPKTLTGLILAGGRGQRMGGADKGWVIHDGSPLIVSVVERFAPQVGQLLISANRNIERYAELGTVIEDDANEVNGERFAGPLIGVLGGLRRACTEWLAVVPCDAPLLPCDLVQRLVSATLDAGAIAGCARVGVQLQPVFAVINISATDGLALAIAGGERAMHRWLES